MVSQNRSSKRGGKVRRALLAVFLGGLMGLAWSPRTEAQVVIDIFGPAIPRFPICVFPFKTEGPDVSSASQEAQRILNQDLRISGFFEILDPSKALADPFRQGLEPREVDFEVLKLLGADIVVGGRMAMEGGNLRWEARLYDQPQRRMLFGKVYKGGSQDVRIMVHRFVDEIVKYYTGAPGIFQTQISFISNRSGAKELMLMDADGENLRQLTQDKNLVLSPRWSPDGREVTFISYTGASAHLFALQLDGLKRRVLSARENMNGPAAWSPDGSRIATTLSIHGNPELYLLDRSGNILQRLTQHPGIDVSPSWSPDGRSLAFVSDRAGGPQIFVMDVASGQARRLTFEGKYNSEPAWSPRGDRIAFSSLVNGAYRICTIRPDGRDLVQLSNGGGSDNSPTWSPDGRYIAFSSTRAGGSQIYIMLFNGQNPVQITRFAGEQSLPAWSPWLQEH
jgi:TolB protein